jgi:hypothetical protein
MYVTTLHRAYLPRFRHEEDTISPGGSPGEGLPASIRQRSWVLSVGLLGPTKDRIFKSAIALAIFHRAYLPRI